ncbi:hypothetical protein Pcinc_027967 [Petrolisthes cinctipes]|uniref:Uncharacterized protein n=1 Tax=Petrolisthes cinctipes TaxID=88211 RepID=A0AAE1F314_PETCI|nr:hypothetical protein Pcinc_027967 [Petrolisthes cinctipes]
MKKRTPPGPWIPPPPPPPYKPMKRTPPTPGPWIPPAPFTPPQAHEEDPPPLGLGYPRPLHPHKPSFHSRMRSTRDDQGN